MRSTQILSCREEEILRFLAEGHSNKAVARRLNISETTVKGHVRTVLRKVGACNRTQAAVWAQTNLAPPPGLSTSLAKYPTGPGVEARIGDVGGSGLGSDVEGRMGFSNGHAERPDDVPVVLASCRSR